MTDRLVLRLFVEDDLAALYRMHGDDEVTRWLLWGPAARTRCGPSRPEATDGTLAADGDGISLAVELRETGETIGDAVLILRSVDNEQGEVGYIIHPDHQGRGYATETTVALLDIAFDESSCTACAAVSSRATWRRAACWSGRACGTRRR